MLVQKKRIKENTPTAFFSAKNRSRFPKARKLASLKQPALFNGKRSRFSLRSKNEVGSFSILEQTERNQTGLNYQGAALFSKNVPDFLYAPKMRSGA
ncbi:MAG: hypothetical protein IKN19_00465, partial [Bacteroidaceae bacterium]|nr:hypothetical protein [Bacteroidaceae bacterium]